MGEVAVCVFSARARPKSATLTTPSSRIKTFRLDVAVDDPLWWASLSASSSASSMSRAARGGSPPSSSTRWRSVRPAHIPSPARPGRGPRPGHRRRRCGMGEASCRAGFAPEAGHETLVVRKMRTHHLQGDIAVEARVDGAIDTRHTAGGDQLEHELSAVDDLADQRIRAHDVHRHDFRPPSWGWPTPPSRRGLRLSPQP